MTFSIQPFCLDHLVDISRIWNDVIIAGTHFPQDKTLSLEECHSLFTQASYTAVAVLNNEVVGVYILYPNNIGRLRKVANASYAADKKARGKKVGKALIMHSLNKSKELNFRILQFNSVVDSNSGAKYLYNKLGFKHAGYIPNCFKINDVNYQGVNIFYYDLTTFSNIQYHNLY